MAQSNDLGGALCYSLIDGSLDIGIQRSTVLTAGNAIDVIAVFILEVGGGGLGEGFGSGDADNGQLFLTQFKDLVGRQHVFAPDAVRFFVEVAGNVGEFGPLLNLLAAFHTVVKLVVAQSCQVISGGVHQIDDGFALVHGTVGSTLNMVTGIYQQNVFVLLLQFGFHRCDYVITQRAIDIGMYIIGVQNGDVLRGLGLGGSSGNCQGKHQHQSQKNCESLAHLKFLLFKESTISVHHFLEKENTQLCKIRHKF